MNPAGTFDIILEPRNQGRMGRPDWRIDNSVHLNVNDMFDAALRNTRIDMSPAERRQFYEKHIKHMTLQIDEDGNVGIELKRG